MSQYGHRDAARTVQGNRHKISRVVPGSVMYSHYTC